MRGVLVSSGRIYGLLSIRSQGLRLKDCYGLGWQALLKAYDKGRSSTASHIFKM
ncbi:hypothetical protein [Desulfuribacillus alkaliarsenatis]|uniref:hypothetical protein n=1 Tax=Desulfuribacillus alkaliarsenatis TaxID=766136 RepID=UPI0015B62C3A|nr:hypothetical protein [Desulfuribacillus alkaliarsenatis]